MKDFFNKAAYRAEDFLDYFMEHLNHPYIFLFTVLGILGLLSVGALIWLSREMLRDEAERKGEVTKESGKNE